MTKAIKNIIVTGTLDDRLNTNVNIRRYLVDAGKNLENINVVNCPTNQIQKFDFSNADIILAVGSILPDENNAYLLQSISKRLNIPLALWLHDDPYEIDFSYRVKTLGDLILTNDRNSLFAYDRPNVFHLPLAGSLQHHYRKLNPNKTLDISFCGYGYENRIEIISASHKFLQNYDYEIYGANWPVNIANCSNIRLNTQDYISLASQSTITLNIGRNFNIANQNNQISPSTPGPRTFEIALAGSAQISFCDSLEIFEYFENEKEILTFANLNDLENLISSLIENPNYARKIARQAQIKAMKYHTYESRLLKFVEICKGVLN